MSVCELAIKVRFTRKVGQDLESVVQDFIVGEPAFTLGLRGSQVIVDFNDCVKKRSQRNIAHFRSYSEKRRQPGKT